MHTYASALRKVGVTVPAHLTADARIPILTGPQAQGDLLVLPAEAPAGAWCRVSGDGVRVVRGEGTGNTHWLHAGFASPDVRWLDAAGARGRPAELAVGYLHVPPGQSAMLIHTDEHGANGIGPGEYALHRKRQKRITFSSQRSAKSPDFDEELVDD